MTLKPWEPLTEVDQRRQKRSLAEISRELDEVGERQKRATTRAQLLECAQRRRELKLEVTQIQPQRMTESLAESGYDYGDYDYDKPNGWLPQSLQGDRTGRAWKAAADRRVPFERVFTHGETPDEVWQSLSSGLVYSMLTSNDLRRMGPDTEL